MRPSTIVFKPHPQSEARKGSAVTLIKCLLAQKKPEVSSAHCRAFDKRYDGWARYREAGIKVINTQTRKHVIY